MAPMPSHRRQVTDVTDEAARYQDLLYLIVRNALEKCVRNPQQAPTDDALPGELPDFLRRPGACFVTLMKNGALRGCIGTLEACRPLLQDLQHNACAAALRDPRFPPVEADELELLEIHVSLLSEPEPMQFDSEQDLLAQLQPGRDGLILRDGPRQGTFLPSVWESLPEREQFWTELKHKAGLPSDHWSDSLQVERYHTRCFRFPPGYRPRHA